MRDGTGPGEAESCGEITIWPSTNGSILSFFLSFPTVFWFFFGFVVGVARILAGSFGFVGFGLLCRHTASNSITTEMHTSGAQ